ASIQALAAVASAIVAAVYAFLTWKMSTSTSRSVAASERSVALALEQQQQAVRPVLYVSLVPDGVPLGQDAARGARGVRVDNAGPGPALGVELTIEHPSLAFAP